MGISQSLEIKQQLSEVQERIKQEER